MISLIAFSAWSEEVDENTVLWFTFDEDFKGEVEDVSGKGCTIQSRFQDNFLVLMKWRRVVRETPIILAMDAIPTSFFSSSRISSSFPSALFTDLLDRFAYPDVRK
jgi:hypothetical protein